MVTKYPKSAARLLDRDCINKGGLDLFKEVLWVSIRQGAAELRAVKVKNPADQPSAGKAGSNRSDRQNFFDPQL